MSELPPRANVWLQVASNDLAWGHAIAVFGGGLHVRLVAAAELDKRGLSGQVLVANHSWGQAGGKHKTSFRAMPISKRELLAKRGVPLTVVAEFGDQVSNTDEEAHAILVWAKRVARTA